MSFATTRLEDAAILSASGAQVIWKTKSCIDKQAVIHSASQVCCHEGIPLLNVQYVTLSQIMSEASCAIDSLLGVEG